MNNLCVHNLYDDLKFKRFWKRKRTGQTISFGLQYRSTLDSLLEARAIVGIEEVSARLLFMDQAIITDIFEAQQSSQYLINAHPVEGVLLRHLVSLCSTQETLNGAVCFEAKEKKTQI